MVAVDRYNYYVSAQTPYGPTNYSHSDPFSTVGVAMPNYDMPFRVVGIPPETTEFQIMNHCDVLSSWRTGLIRATSRHGQFWDPPEVLSPILRFLMWLSPSKEQTVYSAIWVKEGNAWVEKHGSTLPFPSM